MSNAEFNARLARIAESRATQPAAATTAPRAGGPLRPGSDRARLERALSVAESAGISRAAGFPPLMRGLSALGLPVRPLHFKSGLSLFVGGVLLGLFVFGGVLWLVSGADVGAPTRGPVAGLVRLGWTGVYGMSVATGLAFAVIIRLQARSAGLPRWRDL